MGAWLVDNFSLWQPVVLAGITAFWSLGKGLTRLADGFNGWGDTMAKSTETLDDRLHGMENSWAEDMKAWQEQLHAVKSTVEAYREEVHQSRLVTERRLSRLEGKNGVIHG